MSSYLLLRNNKESGPFSFDEIKAMGLKGYDLLWVVGKSAAWRYPGEITELRSFAPPVPEQDSEMLFRKPTAESPKAEGQASPKADSPANRSKENTPPRILSNRSVYVNLPADKRRPSGGSDRVIFEPEFSSSREPEPAAEFSDLYIKPVTPTISFSGKLLWAGTILLLFGAGILTGLFISDRRKFFSTDEKGPQNQQVLQPVAVAVKKDIQPTLILNNPAQLPDKGQPVQTDTARAVNPVVKKGMPARKNLKNAGIKKDTAGIQRAQAILARATDSVKPSTPSKTDLLYQKIKAHPENYVGLEIGRYTTGVFGGISSFPVTVTNNSPVLMDQVVVSVDYIQNNAKLYKSENLSFNALEPGESVTIKAPKSPRGVKVTTRIHMISSRQIDLGYTK